MRITPAAMATERGAGPWKGMRFRPVIGALPACEDAFDRTSVRSESGGASAFGRGRWESSMAVIAVRGATIGLELVFDPITSVVDAFGSSIAPRRAD